MILCRGRELGAEDFPAPIGSPRIETLARPVSSAMSAGQAGGETAELRTLKEVEEEYIDMVMTRAGGDKRQAAEILGIDLSTLYRKMERRKKKGE
jgi:DNA-binding NtrC family response regulator